MNHWFNFKSTTELFEFDSEKVKQREGDSGERILLKNK